jgi:hypothetical protein
MKHIYDVRNVCSCGKTKEQHFGLKMFQAKWQQRHEEGKADVVQMITELREIKAKPLGEKGERV